MGSKKVLIVEDEKSLVGALEKKLNKSGFEVVMAFNGEEGLRKIQETKPDLVLLDIIMPKMDGITMLKKLREKGDKTPVIMLTNLNDSKKLSEAMDAGSYEYLVKSNYSLEDVVDKINKVLN